MDNIPEEGIAKLKHLFNHVLSMRYFPDQFKTAVIKCYDKMLEEIMNRRLQPFRGTTNFATRNTDSDAKGVPTRHSL